MNDAGVDRCASESDDGKSDQRKDGMEGKCQEYHARGDDSAAHTDEEFVAELHSEEAVDKASERQADVEHTRVARRILGGEAPFLYEIGTRPERGCQLHRAVAKEHPEARYRTLDREDLLERQGFRLRFGCHIVGFFSPKRNTCEDNYRQYCLKHRNDQISAVPAFKPR